MEDESVFRNWVANSSFRLIVMSRKSSVCRMGN